MEIKQKTTGMAEALEIALRESSLRGRYQGLNEAYLRDEERFEKTKVEVKKFHRTLQGQQQEELSIVGLIRQADRCRHELYESLETLRIISLRIKSKVDLLEKVRKSAEKEGYVQLQEALKNTHKVWLETKNKVDEFEACLHEAFYSVKDRLNELKKKADLVNSRLKALGGR